MLVLLFFATPALPATCQFASPGIMTDDVHHEFISQFTTPCCDRVGLKVSNTKGACNNLFGSVVKAVPLHNAPTDDEKDTSRVRPVGTQRLAWVGVLR